MQDLGYELPRISIPRTRVNKGKEEGRGIYQLRPSNLAVMSGTHGGIERGR
jgi:hypothetical protein